MRFINHIFLFSLLLFAINCSSKPAPVVQSPQKAMKPTWLGGQENDSLYVYSVYKVEKKDTLNIKRLASNQLKRELEKDFLNHLKSITDSTGLDFSPYEDSMLKKIILRSSKYFSKPEKFIDNNNIYALVKFDKISFLKSFESDLSDTLFKAEQILNNINNNISKENFQSLLKSFDLIINFIGFGPLVSIDIIDKGVVRLILQLKSLTDDYNDRIQVVYKKHYLQKIPLVNESKRVQLLSKDIISGKMIGGLWIDAVFKNLDETDLLISKEDGSIEYQVRELDKFSNGYELNFSVSFKTLLNRELTKLFNIIPKKCKLFVISKSPDIYFENIIKSVDNSLEDSPVVDSIKRCFEKKYAANFIKSRKNSNIALALDITTVENADKISKIYPNFVHASGRLTITDIKSNEEIFTQKIFEESGSDFNSIEKAGINSLKNLAKEVSSKICG